MGRPRIYSTPEEARQARARQTKRRNENQVAEGICVRCRQKHSTGRYYCDVCRPIRAAYVAEWRAAKRARRDAEAARRREE